MSEITYEEFVDGSAEGSVRAMLQRYRGAAWGEHDVQHFLWTGLHGKSWEWLEWDISGRVGDEPDTETAPDPEPPPVVEVAPPADPRIWRGNFLSNGLEPWAFMYPAWRSGRRQAFRNYYRANGWTHVPLGIWGAYDGLSFDYHADPNGYRAILHELRGDGLVPCVFVITDGVHGWSVEPPASRFVSDYLPQIADLVDLFALGWELNEVHGWGKGDDQIGLARAIRKAVGPTKTIYCHFSPERITGHPDYPDHDGPQDEAGWWHKAGDAVDGILYQRSHSEAEADVIAHAIGGQGDVGDVNRIAGDRWGLRGKSFVLFEHSRDLARWERLVSQVGSHPLISGWC